MDRLELIMYNVGRGLAVSLIEYPEKYVTQIDLGSERNFSPLRYLVDRRGLRPDILYITHPHGDHLSDIVNACNARYCPYQFYYQEYDWNEVVFRERPEVSDNIKLFLRLKKLIPFGDYRGSASVKVWHWTPDKARAIFNESGYINNSSLFIVYKWRDFKISICGDLEKEALAEMIRHEGCQNDALGTDILITPLHGLNQGYTTQWTYSLGKPYISLISVHSRTPDFAPEYNSPDFARGWQVSGEKRYALATRSDGTIVANMHYDNDKPVWNFARYK